MNPSIEELVQYMRKSQFSKLQMILKCNKNWFIGHDYTDDDKPEKVLEDPKNILSKLCKLRERILNRGDYSGVSHLGSVDPSVTDGIYSAIGRPSVKTSTVKTPEVKESEVETPEVDTPEVETPEVETPEVDTPEVETPDIKKLDIEKLAIKEPEVEKPSVEKPEVKPEPPVSVEQLGVKPSSEGDLISITPSDSKLDELDTKYDVELIRKDTDTDKPEQMKSYTPTDKPTKPDKDIDKRKKVKRKVIDLSEWELDEDLLDKQFSQPLIKKDAFLDLDLKNSISYETSTVDNILQLLYLPTLANSNKLVMNKNSIIKRKLTDKEFLRVIHIITNQLSPKEKEVFLSCIDYYRGVIPKELIKYKLREVPIEDILRFLYSIQYVLSDRGITSKHVYREISPLLNTKQYNIHVALHLVRLPKISSNISYNIVLSESNVIDPMSDNIDKQVHKLKGKLSSDELDVINTCVDYYEGISSKEDIIHTLQDYPGRLDNIIQFLYNCRHII